MNSKPSSRQQYSQNKKRRIYRVFSFFSSYAAYIALLDLERESAFVVVDHASIPDLIIPSRSSRGGGGGGGGLDRLMYLRHRPPRVFNLVSEYSGPVPASPQLKVPINARAPVPRDIPREMRTVCPLLVRNRMTRRRPHPSFPLPSTSRPSYPLSYGLFRVRPKYAPRASNS